MCMEHVVAKVNELKDGKMKEIKIGKARILLVRQGDEYHALGPKCPHKGAPLEEGSLSDHHVRCPWHQAVFDARNGGLEEPCALDGIPHMDVSVEEDKVLVALPDKIPRRRTPAMAKQDLEADGRTFVILGTGAAGLIAAETLRMDGFQGRITMVTKEKNLPYDRTDLSKYYLADPEADEPFIRSKKFYEKNGIELLTEHKIEEVDVSTKTITFSEGSPLVYDRLLLATGPQPRRLGIIGEDLENVFYIRSYDDCQQIRDLSGRAKKAVVVGSSFIGMEVAAALTDRGLSVTVVAPDSVPFERTFGGKIGRMYQEVHEEKGVAFKLGRRVTSFEGEGKLSAVVLDDGTRLQADLAVVGIGVKPVTSYLKGVDRNEDGSLSVDENLKVTDDVYAAGDIVRFPDWRTGEPIRIEH